mmetsp:Transcript_11242/g.31657  ORF Transcript_11242/g.31657 Transcript_11242/m.31657 type:complete len:221 (-) Transcript_11242:923-1585(-)
MRDDFRLDRRVIEGKVNEAIPNRPKAIRCLEGRCATASSRHNPCRRCHVVGVEVAPPVVDDVKLVVDVVQLLLVLVARDDQVDPMRPSQVSPIPGPLPGRSVCDHDLPISVGPLEEVIHPLHLRSPQIFEVLVASRRRRWPSRAAVVQGFVRGGVTHILRIKVAGIDEVVLHNEAGVAYDCPVVLRGHHPTAGAPRASPCVTNRLVPAGRIPLAPIVLVP